MAYFPVCLLHAQYAQDDAGAKTDRASARMHPTDVHILAKHKNDRNGGEGNRKVHHSILVFFIVFQLITRPNAAGPSGLLP